MPNQLSKAKQLIVALRSLRRCAQLFDSELRAEAQRSQRENKRKECWQSTRDPFVKVLFEDSGASHDGPPYGVIRSVWSFRSKQRSLRPENAGTQTLTKTHLCPDGI